MKALLSDVHSNLEALRAVLDDIKAEGADEIYCLGDMIGYGPNPCECLDLIKGNRIVLMGNHDHAVLTGPVGFNEHAEKMVHWTRAQLLAHPDAGDEAANIYLTYLDQRPQTHRDGPVLYVHASPSDPLREYLFPQDIYNAGKLARNFELVEQCCFHGHTHVPGVITEDRRFFAPEDVENSYRLGARKVLCNVGSVGQPRDGDWRASYVLFDGEVIRFRRVRYDIEATVRKMKRP